MITYYGDASVITSVTHIITAVPDEEMIGGDEQKFDES